MTTNNLRRWIFMKNILIIIALIMCAALTACGSKTQNTNSQGKTNDSNSSSSSASSDDEELTEVDPFDGLKVTFSGMVPDVEMSVIYKGKSRYVRQNIDFVVVSQPAVLKMGEKVIIKAEYKADTPVSERITLLQTEKEYDVEGIDEYVSSEFDSSEIDAAFEKELNNMLHNGEYTKIGKSNISARDLFSLKSYYEEHNEYMIKGYVITPVKTCLEYVEKPQWDNEFHNRYFRIYDVQFVVEKVSEADPIPELSIDYSDGRIIGETYNSDVFCYCMYTDNVMISNGKVVYDTIKCNQERGVAYFDRTWEKLRQDDISEHPTMQIVFEKDLS